MSRSQRQESVKEMRSLSESGNMQELRQKSDASAAEQQIIEPKLLLPAAESEPSLNIKPDPDTMEAPTIEQEVAELQIDLESKQSPSKAEGQSPA